MNIKLTNPKISGIIDKRDVIDNELKKQNDSCIIVEKHVLKPQTESLLPAHMKDYQNYKPIGDRTYTDIFVSMLDREPTEKEIESFHDYLNWYKVRYATNMSSEKLTASFITNNFIQPQVVEEEIKPKRKRRSSAIMKDIENAVEAAKANKALIEESIINESEDEE